MADARPKIFNLAAQVVDEVTSPRGIKANKDL